MRSPRDPTSPKRSLPDPISLNLEAYPGFFELFDPLYILLRLPDRPSLLRGEVATAVGAVAQERLNLRLECLEQTVIKRLRCSTTVQAVQGDSGGLTPKLSDLIFSPDCEHCELLL